MLLHSASSSVRFNKMIDSVIKEAKNQHAELSEADLDRAIRILTLDSLDRIANSLEHIEKRMHQ